jgi:hypothetical protein
MTEPTWTTTRSQLTDALANIEVRGVQLPGRPTATVVAEDMADAILDQLPGGDGSVILSLADVRHVLTLAARDPARWSDAERGAYNRVFDATEPAGADAGTGQGGAGQEPTEALSAAGEASRDA